MQNHTVSCPSFKSKPEVILELNHVCPVLYLADVNEFYMRNDQGMHWCNACGHHSNSAQVIFRHIAARHIKWDLKCKFCEKVVKNPRMLGIHIKKNHWKAKMNMKEMMQWHGIN